MSDPTPNDIIPGYYRGKSKNRRTGEVTHHAFAYWLDSHTGELRCHRDGRDLDELHALEAWPFVCQHPITLDVYVAVTNGEPWPDENAAVRSHNRAPVDDSIEAIAERIHDLELEAERLIAKGPIQFRESADQASDLANTFGELEGKITTLHGAEKRPHLEAGRAVDSKWFGLRDKATDLKRRLKAILTPFLARVEAETHAAKVAAVSAGADPATLPAARTTAGASKRSTALRTYYRAEIEDRGKLLDSLKDHPELIACIQSIANIAAKNKVALPGCRIVSEQRAA